MSVCNEFNGFSLVNQPLYILNCDVFFHKILNHHKNICLLI